MAGIREYILSVSAAAIICGVVGALSQGKTTATQLIKLCSGIFLSLIVISPLADIDLTNFADLTFSHISAAEEAASMGKNLAVDAMTDIIKKRCEAYILDKAKALGAKITVEITVSQDEIPVPQAVVIEGNVSPFAKSQLVSLLCDQLGIPKEDQKWVG